MTASKTPGESSSKMTSSSQQELLKEAGRLVRSSVSPHSPLWLEGFDYPAQYLVRHTRSMTSRFASPEPPPPPPLVVSVPLHSVTLSPSFRLPRLPSNASLQVMDFCLPDDDSFLALKLRKLKKIEQEREEKRKEQNETLQQETGMITNKEKHKDETLLVKNDNETKRRDGSRSSYACLSSLSGAHCTYTELNGAEGRECPPPQSLEIIGCIPVPEVNNTFLWTTNGVGSRLLIVTDTLMSLLDISGCCDHQRSGRKRGRRGRERRRSGRDAMGDGLWSVLESVPVPRGSIKDINFLILHDLDSVNAILSLLGTEECDIRVFRSHLPSYGLQLFKRKPHKVMTAVAVCSSQEDVTVATGWKLPSPSLWLSKLNISHDRQILTLASETELSLVSHCFDCHPLMSLCFVNSMYLLATTDKLLIWENESAKMIKCIRLQCASSDLNQITDSSSYPLVLKGFLECNNQEIFIVICASPPTPQLIQSCCWLVMVSLATSPSIEAPSGQEAAVDKAFKVYAYLLPSCDVISASDENHSRGVCAKSVGLSGDLLTAALSNATLVVWKLNQETPIGYFAFSQGSNVKSIILSQNSTLLSYSDSDKVIYLCQYSRKS